ncbi:response regulator transcription factor [Proteiniphilum sp. X52]|uniref:response regulator transcription factor n=1 Tax=Proteiniphilum sp. X52 TaxID=2382159 RepID=UPI000F0A7C72|nr:LuxR C-terminal-related transcriptional regulator [Proteiniphilum sp. X52]RNC66970.1 DNA-binding response regulator [Proteiniphilum sp. X52]
MNKSTLHIAILESSKIICEGIQAILYQSDMDCRIRRLGTLDELIELLESNPVDILIANPLQFVNREKEIRKIRKSYPSLSIAGIDFGMMHKPSTLTDVTFTLYDSSEHILHLLLKLDKKSQSHSNEKEGEENLTRREVEVLTGLVNGMLNKEIADALNISIHTVVRHRKNIAMKTGIRSQSGLTIYAISKKIISIEDIDL